MGTFYIFDCGYNPLNPKEKHDLTLNVAFEDPPNIIDYLFEEPYPDDTGRLVQRVTALLLEALGSHGTQPHKLVLGLPSHPGPEYMGDWHMIHSTPKNPCRRPVTIISEELRHRLRNQRRQ